MKQQTLKMAIKAIRNYTKSKSVELTFSDNDDGKVYFLTINRNTIRIDIDGKISLEIPAETVDNFKFPEEVTIISVLEISANYQTHSNHIKHEAQFYIFLFRLMGEKVFLILEDETGMHTCWYINKKLITLEQGEDVVCARISDLFCRYRTHGLYEIKMFSAMAKTTTMSDFLDELETSSNEVNKRFIREDDTIVSIQPVK